MNTRRLFTLDSLPKDSSSPEENSFDSHLLPTKEMPRSTCREHKSRQVRSIAHPFGLTASHCFRRGFNVSVPPETPTSPDCLARRKCRASCTTFPSLPSQRPSSEVAGGFRLRNIGCLLAAHSPTREFEARGLTRPRTGYQPASRVVPALVSFFA